MILDPNKVYIITDGKDIHEMRFLGDCDWHDDVVMSLPFLNKIDMNECCYIIPKGATWIVNGVNVMTSLKEIMEGYKPVIQAENNKNKLIPCSERLPEDDDDLVLCLVEYRVLSGTHIGEIRRKYGIGWYSEYYKQWFGDILKIPGYLQVLSWMPLPDIDEE